ncbi:DinB family protein [Sphaerisporangium perillae]|uniref:DinB family protein n=1 Tax=Sphaerisporangium perillae TaxID=2935860 RepID=UPI00200ECB94|nr:DinB family protein [Sphaerisporangium perillae]
MSEITMTGTLMGVRRSPGSDTTEEIVYIDVEQRPGGGPATPSMVSVLEQRGRRVAGYLPWINYYDIDEAARREPGVWSTVEPAERYSALVEWRPYGLRTGGRAASLELAGLLADLAQTPAKLRRTAGMVGEDAETRPEPAEWSITEVAVHVMAADSIMAPRVLQILAQPGLTLPDMDVNEVQRILARARTPLTDRLAGFEARRKEWIAALDQITKDELEYAGEHTRDGTITILDICRAMSLHELEHKKQTESIATRLGYTLG